jgi:iron complex transport system ATP-binding protein
MKENALRIKNLTFSYGDKKIIDKLNVDFQKNKFYSILGPNGSGKSTLLKNIAGILQGNKDSIYVNNAPIESYKVKDLARIIASVHQNIYVDVEFTAFDIVMMGRAPYKNRFALDTKEDLKIVQDAMIMTNTWNLKDMAVNKLSGGEQQRVMAARAIAQCCEILLLDEPVSHMDIRHQYELLSTVKTIKREVTTIAVLHDLNLAALYSDFIILMRDGSIVDIGTPEKVLNKENIKFVYQMDVEIVKDPVNGAPHIIPIVNYREYNKKPVIKAYMM